MTVTTNDLADTATVTVESGDVFAFPPLLAAGPDAVTAAGTEDLCAQIVERVADVARRRGFPLHTAVIFNALHWGFDADEGFYGDPAVLDVLAAAIADTGTVRPGERVKALPIGGFTQLAVGNSSEIWAEIIGKDGRTGSGSNGVIERTQAGGPSDDDVNEAWLLEPAGTNKRWVRKLADWTDAGHLEPTGLVPVTAMYDSAVAANDDDIVFFVRWMVDHAAAALAGGPLGSSLEERPDPATRSGRERLTGALAASCAAIDAVLSGSDEFARWGDYWLLTEWLDDIDERPHQAFGRNDLDSVLIQLARNGAPGTGWATLGPRLGELAGKFEDTSRNRGGTNKRTSGDIDDAAGIERPYYGRQWLKTTVTASRWLANTAATGHGVISVGGQRRYLRIDDRWPWSGAWMASPPPGPDSELWSWPIDAPLWLGRQGIDGLTNLWAQPATDEITTDEPPADEAQETESPAGGDESASQTADEPHLDDDTATEDPAPTAEHTPPEPEPEPGPGTTDASNDEQPTEPATPASQPEPRETPDDKIADAFIEATVSLRATDIDNGTLKLQERFAWFAERLAATQPVFLNLHHDGDIDDDQAHQQLHDCPHELTVGPISWPLDFHPGIHLHIAGIPGLPTIYASTRLSDDGTGFISDIPDGGTPTGRRVTLAGLAIDALRRIGRSSYGTKRATGTQIAEAVFGTDCPDVLRTAIIDVLDALYGTGKLARPGTEYSITDTAPDPTRARFTPSGRASSSPTIAEIRAHIVPGFLRRLPYGHCASAQQELLFLQTRGRSLPPGWTFVREHKRGEHTAAYRAALAGIRTQTGTATPHDIDELISQVFGRHP